MSNIRTDNPLLGAALDYAGRGLPVFPCKRADKAPLVAGGFKAATTDPKLIRNWWSRWPEAMIGMPTGLASGIDVLDLDLKPDEFVDGFKFVPQWKALSRLIVRTPSGGGHVWFKSEGKVRNSTDQVAPGVDTRGDGGYAIVPPSRNRAGHEYAFIKGDLHEIARLPTFPPELFAKLAGKHDGQPGADPEADPERVRAALQVIPNPDLGWEDWKRLGMAIWRATAGSAEGLAAFDEWSQKSNKYNADNTQKEWQNITRSPPSRIGAGTIFYHANEADPGWTRSVKGAAVLRANTPVESARQFVRHIFQRDGAPCLVYYRGCFYEWVGSHYEQPDSVHLRSRLYKFLNEAVTPKGKPFNPTQHKVNQILDALQSVVEENAKWETPFWLGEIKHADEPGTLIACRNGLLNIETRELLPHSPHLFNINTLPYDYDPKAPTYPKLWMQFLRQLWPNDEDDRLARFTLQEMFGLLLTTDTVFQKIFMIVGPKRSGKGTLGRVLTALLGRDNVVNPTMASMTGEFGLWPLIDKQLAIIADARLGARADANVVAERLLSISGEDGQTINRKNKSFWTGRLFVRFLILTNELPRIADASGALASRFILLVLQRSFYGKEDPELTEKLLAELPGILNWALKGLDRLRKRGGFRMPKSSHDAIRQLEDLASPVSAFLRDWCDPPSPDAQENVKDLYAAWSCWCEQQGIRPGSNIVFGRNLRAVRAQIRTGGKGQERFYTGVKLSKEGREQYQLALRSTDWR